jgi:hypothetical protein
VKGWLNDERDVWEDPRVKGAKGCERGQHLAQLPLSSLAAGRPAIADFIHVQSDGPGF